MPTPRKPWPRAVEEQRQEALACAEVSAKKSRKAIDLLYGAAELINIKPAQAEVKIALAQTLIAQALAEQERIQRLLIEAKQIE